MANTISNGLPRVSSTNIPAVREQPIAEVKAPEPGFAGKSTFDKVQNASANAQDIYRRGTTLSSNVTSLTGSLTTDESARDAARAESSADVKQALGVAKEGTNLLGARAKGVGKAITVAQSASTALDANADAVTRTKAALNALAGAKEYIKLGEKADAVLGKGLTSASRFGGSAAGVMNVARSVGEIAVDVKKAMKGDVRAALDGAEQALGLVNSSVGVVKDVTAGAEALGMAGKAVKGLTAVVEAVGPYTKWVPVIGAGVMTAKAAYDLAKEPSWANAGKVALAGVGLIPGVGTGVQYAALGAMTLLENPKAVAKAVEFAAKAYKDPTGTIANVKQSMTQAATKALSFLPASFAPAH